MKLALTHTNLPAAVLAVVLPLMLLALAVASPLLGEPLRGGLAAAFAPLCHQIAERSFALAGAPMVLCQRCTGFVAGLVLGAAAGLLAGGGRSVPGRGPAVVLAVAFLPLAVDWGLDAAGLWTNTVASRVITGTWAGAGVGALVVYALAQPSAAEAQQTARRPVQEL